ncbi:MAG TPA: copper resistance protein CopC [Ktedonobacteraceae bacterium]
MRGACLTILGLFFSLLPVSLLTTTVQAHTLQAAHAEYVSSDPASNAMLKTAPTTVVVHFSEAVNPNGSNLLVYDVNGKLISPAAAQVDRNDLKAMTVSIQPDGSEVYVVLWHTVSAVEGHHDSGSFRFFVNISPMLQSMVSGKMSGMSGTSGTNSSSSGSSTSAGMPVWAAILIGIIGLIIGVGASFLFLRSRPAKVQRG